MRKEQLHEFRKEIDTLIQKAGNEKEFLNTQPVENRTYVREIAICHTKLQEAKMWAGKCLEMLGSSLPKEFQDKAE